MPNRSTFDNIFLVVKGVAMGTANKIPGVSGGIVAFVGGFYEEFIYSLQKFNRKALGLLFRRGFSSFFEYINAKFLGLLVLGMLISYFTMSKMLDYFMKLNELAVWSVFFGMIVGSLYFILKDFKDWRIRTIIACLLGLLVGTSISFLTPGEENRSLPFVFFCGIISVSGMTLPGLSGSFLLLIMGNYVLLLVDSVNVLYDVIVGVVTGDLSVFGNPDNVYMLTILGVFTLGSIIGMVSFSQLLSYFLKKFHNITIAIIIGFITGSLGVVWPWKMPVYKLAADGQFFINSDGNKVVKHYDRFFPDLSQGVTWQMIGFIVSGILLILVLEWYGKRKRV